MLIKYFLYWKTYIALSHLYSWSNTRYYPKKSLLYIIPGPSQLHQRSNTISTIIMLAFLQILLMQIYNIFLQQPHVGYMYLVICFYLRPYGCSLSHKEIQSLSSHSWKLILSLSQEVHVFFREYFLFGQYQKGYLFSMCQIQLSFVFYYHELLKTSDWYGYIYMQLYNTPKV